MNKLKYIRKEVSIPDTFQNIDNWEVDRRKFLRATLLAGAATQISWFTSCSRQLEQANDYLTAEQSTILKDILMIIFPEDGNGPSANDINSFGYILWVLSDNYRKPEDNEYIMEGINWANETSIEIYDQPFIELSKEEQEKMVELFTEMEWGKNWMSVMVTLVLESLLLDPIYGGNTDEKGWQWLDHVAGVPRPTEETRFESFIHKYKPGQI
ncbi:MAG: gluconate 2-dehydrogenase subunit 3 family protein [Crocinitomicaceae bacterium]|nr:gluconate 2-dehydrogenase subunit 3 family protein [Crocinitomicaceae bacterium]